MKRILHLFAVIAILVIIPFGVNAQCKGFAKKICKVCVLQFLERLHLRVMATGEGNVTAIVWAQKNRCRKYYKERAPKGQQQIQLNATMDVKQLVANMQPEQISQLVAAIEAKTLELEASKDENS
jgi:hypothetical protein